MRDPEMREGMIGYEREDRSKLWIETVRGKTRSNIVREG